MTIIKAELSNNEGRYKQMTLVETWGHSWKYRHANEVKIQREKEELKQGREYKQREEVQ